MVACARRLERVSAAWVIIQVRIIIPCVRPAHQYHCGRVNESGAFTWAPTLYGRLAEHVRVAG